MKRREFLGLAAAWGGVMAVLPDVALASSGHPFGRLIDLGTEKPYQPDPRKFTLALFMTAQQNYADCGGAFLGVQALQDMLQAQNKIDPVFVMPKISDQSVPGDMRNLNRAIQYKMRVLTGDFPDIQAAAASVGAFFETDAQGKADGHTLEGFFLAPDGDRLIKGRIDDYMTFSPLVSDIMQKYQFSSKTEEAQLLPLTS